MYYIINYPNVAFNKNIIFDAVPLLTYQTMCNQAKNQALKTNSPALHKHAPQQLQTRTTSQTAYFAI